MRRRGVIRCLVAAVLFGAAAPAASRLVVGMSALVLAGLLYLGAALAVAPAVARRRLAVSALRRGWLPVAGAVVFGGALGPALLMAGLAHTDAATASILLNLELVATVALAATLFREHLGGRVVAGAASVAAGGALLAWPSGAQPSVGALLIAAACACWGVDNCLTARIDQVPPEHVVFLKGVVAGGVNVALGLLAAGGAGGMATGPVLVALAVGALGYGLSITQWVKGARDLGAARGQVIFATAPFIGTAIAWLALHETVTLRQVLAALLAAGGVTLSLETAHDHEHHHEPVDHEHEHDHDDGHHDHDHDHPGDARGRHAHPHRHASLVHSHPHLPDLHHRHDHA